MVKNEISNLEGLEKKEADIKRLINSLTSDLNIVQGAKKVMKRNYDMETHVGIPLPEEDYYATPTIMVYELLANEPKAWSLPEIIAELNRTGVKSNAKNLASPVSTVLRNLHARSLIKITGMKRKRKYKWIIR